MCTVLLAWRCMDDATFVLAANRDELVRRPSAAPGRLADSPPAFGGRDLVAGGTWLAVAPDGRVVAVTNRREDDRDEVTRDPTLRSRGELPLRLLRESNGDSVAALHAVRPADYNPFNVLLLTDDVALVGHGGGGEHLEVVALQPGMHVLCVHDVDDSAHAKERHLKQHLHDAVHCERTAAAHIAVMLTTLTDHGSDITDPRDAACIHGETYGTVSASLVVGSAQGTVRYTHAAGRPCVTPFLQVALR
jgi:uncharacterized protein with NRDE domain